MFEILKLERECKSFLKNYNIKWSEEIHLSKKGILYIAKIMDWRGPIDLDGFPTLSYKSAKDKLIEMHVFEFACNKEVEMRQLLVKNYPINYGEYEARKYIFEFELEILYRYDK